MMMMRESEEIYIAEFEQSDRKNEDFESDELRTNNDGFIIIRQLR